MLIDPTTSVEILKSFVVLHPYLILGIGFFFARESVFIPALYLVFAGKLELSLLIPLMIIMNTISDAVLYAIGRFVSEERLRKIFGARIFTYIDEGGELFAANSMKTIFISRFVYGTRTAAQVLSGLFCIPFHRYLLVNTAAITLFILALAGIIASVRISIDIFASGIKIAQMFMLIGVLVYLAWRAVTKHTTIRR